MRKFLCKINNNYKSRNWRRDWRDVFINSTWPTVIENSAYEKKLTISKSDTLKYYSEYYVLITATTNMGMTIEYDNEKLPFRLNLNRRVIKYSTKIPSQEVNIHLNEFIIGNILNEHFDNRKFD